MPIEEIVVCTNETLDNNDFVIVDIEYFKKKHSAIVFRYLGRVYAYLNQCVHMPRQLNCEKNTVFDKDRKFLRCSMHGIVYDPVSGKSVSTMCNGQKLVPLRCKNIDNQIVLSQKHVKSITTTTNT